MEKEKNNGTELGKVPLQEGWGGEAEQPDRMVSFKSAWPTLSRKRPHRRAGGEMAVKRRPSRQKKACEKDLIQPD